MTTDIKTIKERLIDNIAYQKVGHLHDLFRGALDCIAELEEQLSAQTAEPVVDDLRMLVVRLARALNKAIPDNTLSYKALDYLERKGLQGSPLRAETEQPSLTDAEIARAAVQHGVEDPLNEKNEMVHRRIASMVRALLAQRQDSDKDAAPVKAPAKRCGTCRHSDTAPDGACQTCFSDPTSMHNKLLNWEPIVANGSVMAKDR